MGKRGTPHSQGQVFKEFIRALHVKYEKGRAEGGQEGTGLKPFNTRGSVLDLCPGPARIRQHAKAKHCCFTTGLARRPFPERRPSDEGAAFARYQQVGQIWFKPVATMLIRIVTSPKVSFIGISDFAGELELKSTRKWVESLISQISTSHLAPRLVISNLLPCASAAAELTITCAEV